MFGEDEHDELTQENYAAGIAMCRDRLNALQPTEQDLNFIVGALMLLTPWDTLEAIDTLMTRRLWDSLQDTLKPILAEFRDTR